MLSRISRIVPLRRIVRIQILEQSDKLHASVSLLNSCRDVPILGIQAGQDRPGAIADMLVIARYSGILARGWRQIRRGVANSLHTGFSSTDTVVTWPGGPPFRRIWFCSAISW